MHVVRRMCEMRELLDRYRGGFPGDFWNRFGMEIITADLNDYLRIYLLPSLLAFLLVVPPPSSRTPRERHYGFIIVHADSFFHRAIPVGCLLISMTQKRMRCSIDNNNFENCLIIVRLMKSIRSQRDKI